MTALSAGTPVAFVCASVAFGGVVVAATGGATVGWAVDVVFTTAGAAASVGSAVVGVVGVGAAAASDGDFGGVTHSGAAGATMT